MSSKTKKETVLTNQLIRSGVSVDTLVRQQIEKAEALGKKLTYTRAHEEVVADSMETMLADGTLIEKLRILSVKDKSIVAKIENFLKNLVAKIKKAYEGLRPDSQEGRIVAEMVDTSEQLHQLFADAIADASENFKNAVDSSGNVKQSDIRYSERNFVEDKYFKSQMSKWEDLKHGSYVKVGAIGENHPLFSVGMPDGTLRYDVDKLKKNMTEHNDYLTVDLLKLIPDIIANPIAISEFSAENTVSVFGDVFVGSSPMMVGVTISKDRAGNDISKVRTYNTRRDVGKLITDETVLYLNEDKKRTRKWFQACGIQVPLGETKFGFIRSISQKNSKSQEKNSDRDPNALTPRNLLANALEESAVHEVEKKKLAEYKDNIEKLYAKEQELYEVRKEIKELSFAPGKRDTAKLKQLQEKATKLSNNVTLYDKKLLTLESTSFLKNVLEREKAKAIKRQKEKDAERLKAQKEKALQREKAIVERYQDSRKKSVESRNRTAMRNKIKS